MMLTCILLKCFNPTAQVLHSTNEGIKSIEGKPNEFVISLQHSTGSRPIDDLQVNSGKCCYVANLELNLTAIYNHFHPTQCGSIKNELCFFNDKREVTLLK